MMTLDMDIINSLVTTDRPTNIKSHIKDLSSIARKRGWEGGREGGGGNSSFSFVNLTKLFSDK
jgi:hypothetical protein